MSASELRTPGHGGGLVDVVRRRFLLSLLVRKELRVRYRGSVLGLVWSYVKPAVQLLVFYIALGKFLSLDKAMPAYIIYLFSGIVVVNFFSEIFGNATRSVVNNADLVKKIYMPRELFPVASLFVAIVHMLPQLLVLLIASVAFGWSPDLASLVSLVGALVVTMLVGLGLGLLFGAVNVTFRDAENFVDLVLMMATWLSPVLYTWQKVADVTPSWLFHLYQANPLTGAVEMAHAAFWARTDGVVDASVVAPPHYPLWAALAVVLSALILAVGQFAFHRLEGRFAQEL